MPSAWQTLEEAALTLGISSRTLHRRLARGDFQTRLESGRREVLVVVGELEIESESRQTPMSDAPANMSDSVRHGDGDVQHAVLALHEDRIRRTDLAIMAYQQSVTVAAADARRAHRNSRIAWSSAGALVIVTFLAVTWATHRMTNAHADVTHMSDSVRQLSATADAKAREAEQHRKVAETARIATAKAEGELSAAKERLDALARQTEALQAKYIESVRSAAPATQPSATTQPVSAAR